MKRVKTSLTDPIKIAEVRHHVFTGVIGITFCPGKKQEDGWTAVWDRNLSTDLDAIKQWGATTVISLIEDHEIADLCVGRLGTDVAARGMQWLHLPIVDMSVPDHRFQAGWLEVRGKILEQLRSGSRIVVHCKGGLGRAGTVSARILLELGVSAEEAIGLVRAARPGAIENDQQEEYVREFGELLSQTDTSRMNRYARLLPTLERELGSDRCKEVMCALWASRNGMTKKEVMAYADMLESQWQSFFQTMGSALRINEYRVLLADDDVKNTVAERYLVQDVTLSGEMTFGKLRSLRNEAHAKLARWFEQHAFRNEKTAQFAVDDARAAEEVPYQWWKARDWTALQAVLTNRDMFLALYVNRSNQEILSYWLDLERETNIELETAYEAVWWRWCADDLSEETGDIADRLRSFLVEAGRYRKLADNLARLALAAESMTYGPESEQVSARLNDLALLLEAQGKADDAEFLMRRALAIAEKTLGSEQRWLGLFEQFAVVS